MEQYDTTVKCYKRKNSKQYLITLRQDHPFNESEKVIVVKEKDMQNHEIYVQKQETQLKSQKNEIQNLKVKISSLEESKVFKEKYDVLLNDMDRLRNKHDHLQERLNKSQEEIIHLERELTDYRLAISKVQNLGFMDRLLNKLPDEVKRLESKEVKKE